MKSQRSSFLSLIVLGIALTLPCYSAEKVLWKIGEADQSTSGFAMAPSEYKRFLEFDFGWEDRYFLVGVSDPAKDWPYVLPGPKDTWGGTWGTSGIRSHLLTILFGIQSWSGQGNYTLVVDILDCHSTLPPLLKILVNGTPWTFQLKPGRGAGIDNRISEWRMPPLFFRPS